LAAPAFSGKIKARLGGEILKVARAFVDGARRFHKKKAWNAEADSFAARPQA